MCLDSYFRNLTFVTVMQSKVWYFYEVFPKQAASAHVIYVHAEELMGSE